MRCTIVTKEPPQNYNKVKYRYQGTSNYSYVGRRKDEDVGEFTRSKQFLSVSIKSETITEKSVKTRLFFSLAIKDSFKNRK